MKFVDFIICSEFNLINIVVIFFFFVELFMLGKWVIFKVGECFKNVVYLVFCFFCRLFCEKNFGNR